MGYKESPAANKMRSILKIVNCMTDPIYRFKEQVRLGTTGTRMKKSHLLRKCFIMKEVNYLRKMAKNIWRCYQS